MSISFSHASRSDEIEDFLSRGTTTATAMVSPSPEPEPDDETDAMPDGPISPTRFFFSLHDSSSIMEEAKAEMGLVTVVPPLVGSWQQTGEPVVVKGPFGKESVAVAMASTNPYSDFRASMEEMVAAHNLREWRGLQELLHCYLRMNERKTHKIIMLAFGDVLMHLTSQDKEGFPASFPSHCLR